MQNPGLLNNVHSSLDPSAFGSRLKLAFLLEYHSMTKGIPFCFDPRAKCWKKMLPASKCFSSNRLTFRPNLNVKWACSRKLILHSDLFKKYRKISMYVHRNFLCCLLFKHRFSKFYLGTEKETYFFVYFLSLFLKFRLISRVSDTFTIVKTVQSYQ